MRPRCANVDASRYSASEAAAEINAGRLTAEEYVSACLERIAQREKDVHAWARIDPDLALRQARDRQDEPSRGPLHGVPVGFKDVFDTAELPTEYGSPIYKNHRPKSDAASVALAKKAGAIVLGKTVTAEFANRSPGPTRNPHNLAHTPGGSSSGSAAAVADFMVPIAVGTQTAGSTIRPASFCGIVGYKPSFNLINRAGLKSSAESLDHIGVLARTVEDVALFTRAVSGIGLPDFTHGPSTPPRIGFCRQPHWDDGEPAMHDKLELAARTLARQGSTITEIVLAGELAGAAADLGVIIDFETARALAFEFQNHREKLSALMLENLENGWRCPRDRYERAMANAVKCRVRLSELFAECDFLLTPAAPGEAPAGIERTGNSIFNRIWTLCGVPCVTVPAYAGPKGLPIGVQIVGPYGRDTQTLHWADWVRRSIAT